MSIAESDIIKKQYNLVTVSKASIGPTIKSIQKGYAIGDTNGVITVSLYTVNPSKCVASIYAGGIYYGASSQLSMGYITGLTASTLSIGGCRYYTGSVWSGTACWWTVVEYE